METSRTGVRVDWLDTQRWPAALVMQFENVDGALIQSCTAAKGTGTFLQFTGDVNQDVLMTGNRLTKAPKERKVANQRRCGPRPAAV